jgi:hypothetical protein
LDAHVRMPLFEDVTWTFALVCGDARPLPAARRRDLYNETQRVTAHIHRTVDVPGQDVEGGLRGRRNGDHP